MKKYLLYICIATLLVSCHKTDAPPTTSGDTMSFTAQLSNKEDDWSVSSRGVVTTNSTITSFSAFCYRTGSRMWSEVGASSVPNKMFDQRVERNGDNWVYTPEVMWEGGDGSHFTFFGYSPYSTGVYDQASNPTGNNIEVTSTITTTGAPVISFAPLTDVSSQIDLLVAKPVFDTRPVDYVTMNFTHALTQVRFKGWAEQPNTEVTGIAVKGVKGKATLNIGGIDNDWVAGAETADYAYTILPTAVSADKDLMTDLSTNNNAFMLLPQDMTGNTTAVVEFTYTVDGVAHTKEYVIKESWKRNQAMIYTVNLTEADEPLGVTVAITPWVVGTGGVGDADGEALPEEVNHIPTTVLRTAGWPVDRLPVKGLQIATRGNVLPGGKPAAEDPRVQWSTGSVATSITASGLGAGKDNYAQFASVDAAEYPIGQACQHLGPEWYVPSKDELKLIYDNRSIFGASYTFIINPSKAYFYWSTSDAFKQFTWFVNFADGKEGITPKGTLCYVRCVREI